MLAQELVDRLNEEAVTWHAVGMYYLYIKKYAEARRYFRYSFLFCLTTCCSELMYDTKNNIIIVFIKSGNIY